MRMVIHADLEPVSARLGRLAVGLRDLTPVMAEIGSLVEGSTRRRIAETKTAPDGTPWEGLSEKTLKRKKGRGSILVEHGALLRGITHEASANSVIVGSNQVYAMFHQNGTGRMKARPFLGLSDEDVRDINEHLDAHINRLIGGGE